MMAIGVNLGKGLLVPEVVGTPNSNQCWIRGEDDVIAWRIIERSVTEERNSIQIVQADGTKWWVEVKHFRPGHYPVKGHVSKMAVNVARCDTYTDFKESEKAKYQYGEIVKPFGVSADFLISIGMLSAAELKTMMRPVQSLSEMESGSLEEPEQPTDVTYAAFTDEQSAQIACREQKIERLEERVSGLKNEISRSQELLSELDSNIGVKLLADSDKYSLASYPDVPHYPRYEIKDVRKHFKGKAGIYFATSKKNGGIEYVGRSEDLGSRVCGGRNELRGCVISILQMPEWETHAAELAYIAACRPARNAHIQRAKNGRVNSGTPKEYLTVSQARDYVARTTWGAKTLHDATIDGLKIKAISDGRELVSVADLKRIVESEWCFEEIEAAHRAAEQGKKLKRGIKF